MSSVNEWVVREYFEQLGFLVSQPRKYAVPGRPKKAEEEVDLLVLNPTVADHQVPEGLIWTGAELKHIARAIVGVRGWHTERFYAQRFEQSPDITRFAEPESVRFAAKLLGSSSMAKILCLPELPASGELKQKSMDALKRKGIDGIISFRTILTELVAGVGVNRNYEKSDLLQVIRLLKNYDLLREKQMDLFARRKPRKSKPVAPPAPPSAAEAAGNA